MRLFAKPPWILAVLCLLLQLGGGAAIAQDRVALIIGNGKYASSTPLPNPPSDARAVAKALSEIGFIVSQGTDLDKSGMESLLRDFLRKASVARVALLFYAGHGMQVDGKNYLIPIDAKLETASDLNFGTIELDRILASLDDPKRATIIILDACRDNPMARSFASRGGGGTRSAVGTGLAGYSALGSGTLIAFATAPGAVALDGAGSNSPFTLGLVKHLKTPGLEVRQMLTRVRAEVAVATNDKQIPWDNSSLRGDVYLAGLPSSPPSTASPDEVRAMQQKLIEMEAKLRARDEPKIAATPQANTPAVITPRPAPTNPVAPSPTPPQVTATAPSSSLDKPWKPLGEPGQTPTVEWERKTAAVYRNFNDEFYNVSPEQAHPSGQGLRHIKDHKIHEGRDNAAAFLPDSRTVMSMSDGEGLIQWDVDSGTRLRDWPWYRHDYPERMAVTPDGSRLIVKSWKGLHVYTGVAGATSNPKLEREIETKVEDKDPCKSKAFALSPQSDILALASTPSILQLYDLKSGKVVRSLSDGKPAGCATNAAAFSPDGKLIFSSSSQLWNIATGKPAAAFVLRPAATASPILDMAFADNGRSIAAIFEKQLVLLNAETGAAIWTVQYPGTCRPASVAYPDSRHVISACDKTFRVYDATSGTLLQLVKTPGNKEIESLTVSPDRKRLLTKYSYGGFGVWENIEPQISLRN